MLKTLQAHARSNNFGSRNNKRGLASQSQEECVIVVIVKLFPDMQSHLVGWQPTEEQRIGAVLQ